MSMSLVVSAAETTAEVTTEIVVEESTQDVVEDILQEDEVTKENVSTIDETSEAVIANTENTVESLVEETQTEPSCEIESEQVYAAYTGLVNCGGNVWQYQSNGVTQWNYTGLTNYYGTWYYVEKGVLNWEYTGLTNYYGTWYYVEKGVLNWKYTGLTNYYGTWYYVEKGVLNWKYTSLTNYYGTWYYVEKGVLNWNYTGLTNYYGTWYYVEKGVLNWNYTGLTNYYGTWYYVEKGILNWKYTGFTEYYGTRYYVEKGVLNQNYIVFDMQRISIASNRFEIAPVVAGVVLDSYGHGYKSSNNKNPWNWDGVTTTWTFNNLDGNSRKRIEVDLITAIGKIYYGNTYYGSVNLSTKKVLDGNNIKKFFNNLHSSEFYMWSDYGGSAVKISGVETLGKFEAGRVLGCSVTLKYSGTNEKNRAIFNATDALGNPKGYVVTDAMYNYFDVYDMHCVHVGTGCAIP